MIEEAKNDVKSIRFDHELIHVFQHTLKLEDKGLLASESSDNLEVYRTYHFRIGEYYYRCRERIQHPGSGAIVDGGDCEEFDNSEKLGVLLNAFGLGCYDIMWVNPCDLKSYFHSLSSARLNRE